MKKLIFIASLLIAMILPSNLEARKVAYRGFADVIGGYWCPNIGISTTHGVQCSSKYFIGLGAEFNWTAYDEVGIGGAFYIRNRLDLPNSRKCHFFGDLDTGFSIGGYDTAVSPYLTLSPGIRIAISDKLGFNLGIMVGLTGHKYDDWNYETETEFDIFLGGRIGFDF